MAREISQAIVDGILIGGVYALMAVGLTLIFGVLDIINIAQGVLVILGAYLSYSLFTKAHIDLFVGLLITVPAMFVIGVVIHWAFIRRLRGTERTSMTLLVTYAVALIIEGILFKIYGRELRPDQRLVHEHERARLRLLHRAGSTSTGFILAVALVVALYALLYRTRFGRSVRATMQDETAARLVGIDVNRVAALTFGIGVAVTAAGGMVFGATNALQRQQRLRPDLPAAGHHHPRRHGQHRRCARRLRLHAHPGVGGDDLVPDLGGRRLLRRARAGPGDPPDGLFGRKAVRAQ